MELRELLRTAVKAGDGNRPVTAPGKRPRTAEVSFGRAKRSLAHDLSDDASAPKNEPALAGGRASRSVRFWRCVERVSGRA